MTEKELNRMVEESIAQQVNEGKLGNLAAGIGLSALTLGAPSCSYVERNQPSQYNPQWEHEGPYSEQEKMDKTYNTHAERGDWNNAGDGEGYIYDCYTRCANSGGGWTIHVIFKDKSTGKFILPQHPEEYLFGRYMPNCNCFENENTTDHVNTNGLQRQGGEGNTTIFENKWNKNMKKTSKINEAQLRKMIREALNELDPRTYAKYADMRQQQANGQMAPSQAQTRKGLNQQQMQAQAQQGRQAAVNAWNRDYGWTDKNEWGDEYYKMIDGKSNGKPTYVTDWQEQSNGWGAPKKATYFPNSRGGGETFGQASNGYQRWTPERVDDLGDGDRVAHQMQYGTGTYDKQTGKWVNEDRITEAVKNSIKKVLKENFDEDPMQHAIEIGRQICDRLQQLNFDGRGHKVQMYDEEYPVEIGVWDMNVPANADCRMIAEEFGCDFRVDSGLNIGIFEIE